MNSFIDVIRVFRLLIRSSFLILVLVACVPGTPVPEVDPTEEKSHQVEEKTREYLSRISESYESKDFEQHAQLTLTILLFHARNPLLLLYDSYESLLTRIEENGPNSYLSIILEAVHRSAYSPTERSRNFVIELKKILDRKDAFSDSNIRNTEGIVFVRTIGRRSFRPFSAHEGWAALALMLSEFDGRFFVSNYAPETYVRVGDMLGLCLDQIGDEEQEDSISIENLKCLKLAEAIAEDFRDGSSGDLAGTMANVGSIQGAVFGGDECVESLGDTTFQETIDSFDQFHSCIEDEMWGTRPSFDPYGSLLEGDSYSSNDTLEAIRAGLAARGYTTDGKVESNHITFEGEDGFWDFIALYSEVWTNGEEDIILETQTYPEGDAEGSLRITEKFEDGSFNYTVTNNQGAVVRAGHKDPWTGEESFIDFDPNNGMPIQAGYSNPSTGESYEAEYNDNGTLKSETFTDEDGNETTVTYDSDGNCTSNCDHAPCPSCSSSTSQPPDDEYRATQCAATRAGRPGDFENIVTKLDTLIYPSPDSIEPADNPCFNVSSSAQLYKCTSVALCLEGAVIDENCNCTYPGDEVDLSAAGGTCNVIMCKEGYTCDPATGLCTGSTDLGLDVGGINPIPIPYDLAVLALERNHNLLTGVLTRDFDNIAEVIRENAPNP